MLKKVFCQAFQKNRSLISSLSKFISKNFSTSKEAECVKPPEYPGNSQNSGCGKESCACKGAVYNEANDCEDPLEKKFKNTNYKIIQCINLGQYQEAFDLSEEYISELLTNYNNEHPFYLSALNNKAYVLKVCGELAEAKELYLEVVEKYKKIYGNKSEKYIIGMQNLGTLYREMKEFEKALLTFEEILKIIKESSQNTENNNEKVVAPNIEANILNAVGGNSKLIRLFKMPKKIRKVP